MRDIYGTIYGNRKTTMEILQLYQHNNVFSNLLANALGFSTLLERA